MLTVLQTARALGVSTGRIYRALSRPYPLPYIIASTPAKAGGQERHYSISVLLPRLKSAFAVSPKQVKALFREGSYNV